MDGRLTAPAEIPVRPAAPNTGAARKATIGKAILGGPILATMLGLALPTIVVLVAQTFVGVIETFYVSFLGTDALVGVALVFPIFMLMTMMSNGGIGGGVASAVARAIGAGRRDDADSLVVHALLLAAIFGVAFTAAVMLCGPALFHALGGDAGALRAALLYSGFVFAGAVPMWIVNLMSAALRGAGNVRAPALVTLAGAVVLIPLSPLLIFGLGPVHGFGIAGAGIAVTTYYSVAAIVLLRYMLRGGGSSVSLKRSRLEGRLFGDILGVGSISALSTVQLNLTVVLVTGAVGRFGTDALAGYGIASRLDYILIPLLFGLGTSVLTMVATNVGAGDLARARRIAWIGAFVGAGFTEAIGILAAAFPALWIGVFSRDPAVIAVGSTYLRTVAPIYGAVGITFVLSFASQGGGRPIWTFLGGTARLLIAAGVGWLAVADLGAGTATLFLIVAGSSIVSAAICVVATVSGATVRPGKE
jgi:putative MATE family efflux protein